MVNIVFSFSKQIFSFSLFCHCEPCVFAPTLLRARILVCEEVPLLPIHQADRNTGLLPATLLAMQYTVALEVRCQETIPFQRDYF